MDCMWRGGKERVKDCQVSHLSRWVGMGSRVLLALRRHISVSEGDYEDTVGGVSHKGSSQLQVLMPSLAVHCLSHLR